MALSSAYLVPFHAVSLGRMLDERAAKLLTTSQFTDNSEITGWFDLVRQVYEEQPDANAADFGARLTSAAGSYDSTSVRNFVQELESAGDRLAPHRSCPGIGDCQPSP
jgi:hypothetical protein